MPDRAATMRHPSDIEVRRRAVDPRHSYLIQAPAGSGKTELLTDRILALLATVERPEEIVAITFTRKAASEMHARVLDKLRQGQSETPPQEAYKIPSWQLARNALARDSEKGWNLLAYPARLSIRTIDSFCAYLVRAMPWLSAMGGMPTITESPRDLYEAAAQATLDMADDNAAVAGLIAHLDVDIRVARALLADMLASRDQWLPLLGRGSHNEQLLESLVRAVEDDLRRLGAAMPVGWADALAPCLRKAAETLVANGQQPEHLLRDWDGHPFGTDIDCLPLWQALSQALLTGTGTLRRTVNKNQGFEPKTRHKEDFLTWLGAVPENEEWVAILNEIRLAPPGGYTSEQERVLRILLEVLWLAAAQLRLQFAQAAEVDFIEISQRALEALGRVDDPSDLLLSLDSAIRHILVDEFQDTSQTQIRLLELLTAGWEQGDGHTLFLVGDPMQSIYRFRKADVGGFLNVRDQGLGTIELKADYLRENFRSQGALVQWVNRICQPIFPARNHPALGAISYTPSVPFNAPVSGVTAQFHPVWVSKEAPEEDQDLVAQDVGGSSASPIPDDGAQGLNAAHPGDDADALAIRLAREALQEHADSEHPVAILVRARSHLAGLVHKLAQAGVPCRAVDLVTLQSRQVVIDLAQLARALAHPADRLAWLSVLRSPLCGLTLSSLHAVFGGNLQTPVPQQLQAWMSANNAGEGRLPEGEAQRLRLAATALLDDANAAGSLPFAAWLESCWQRLGGPDIYYRNATDAADAERLFRLVEEIAPYGQLDPVDLERRLEKLFAVPESSGRAVQVMTIHKSKGLEFDTVIMTGLHRKPKSDTLPLMLFEPQGEQLLLGPIRHRVTAEADPVTSYLAAREKKRAAYETDRLLYVGLTRACQRLHLIGEVVLDEAGKPRKPAPSSLLGRLWDQLELPEPPPVARGESLAQAPAVAADAREANGIEEDAASARRLGQRYLVRRKLEALLPVKDRGPVTARRQAQDETDWKAQEPGQGTLPGFGDLAPDTPATALPPASSPAASDKRAAGRPASWSWREQSGEEAVIGTVAHAWLERIGKDGPQAWPPSRIVDAQPVFRRQLARAGLPDASLNAAAQTLRETLTATLASERGQWLLRVAQAHREWSLLDISGRVSIIDLAISQENDWLVVDYKTGMPHPGESRETYAARMRERYREQMERYCDHVTALDGRPARAALYFPRADIWVDYPVRAPA